MPNLGASRDVMCSGPEGQSSVWIAKAPSLFELRSGATAKTWTSIMGDNATAVVMVGPVDMGPNDDNRYEWFGRVAFGLPGSEKHLVTSAGVAGWPESLQRSERACLSGPFGEVVCLNGFSRALFTVVDQVQPADSNADMGRTVSMDDEGRLVARSAAVSTTTGSQGPTQLETTTTVIKGGVVSAASIIEIFAQSEGY